MKTKTSETKKNIALKIQAIVNELIKTNISVSKEEVHKQLESNGFTKAQYIPVLKTMETIRQITQKLEGKSIAEHEQAFKDAKIPVEIYTNCLPKEVQEVNTQQNEVPTDAAGATEVTDLASEGALEGAGEKIDEVIDATETQEKNQINAIIYCLKKSKKDKTPVYFFMELKKEMEKDLGKEGTRIFEKHIKFIKEQLGMKNGDASNNNGDTDNSIPMIDPKTQAEEVAKGVGNLHKLSFKQKYDVWMKENHKIVDNALIGVCAIVTVAVSLALGYGGYKLYSYFTQEAQITAKAQQKQPTAPATAQKKVPAAKATAQQKQPAASNLVEKTQLAALPAASNLELQKQLDACNLALQTKTLPTKDEKTTKGKRRGGLPTARIDFALTDVPQQ